METLKAEIENERQVAEQAKRSEKNLQYTISSLKSDLAAQR